LIKPGTQRLYNKAFAERGREDVVLWDVLPIEPRQLIKVVFEAVSSPWRQGVWLKTDRGLIVNNQYCGSVDLWVDTASREVLCDCISDDGSLSVYNIWDSGRGYDRESQSFSSGMLVEDLPDGRRYRCNDIGFETNFDRLVFTEPVRNFVCGA
jgi:hypothetical protein